MQYLTTLIVLVALIGSARATAVLRRQAGVITQCTRPNTAALTFDDGPYLYAQEIGDTLAAAGAKGTFFVNGQNYACIYSEDSVQRLKYVYNQGHQVSSHTWSHRDLATLPYDQIADEMQRVNDALTKIIGATPAFTRPPFGSYNDLVLSVAAEKGQTLVNWDFDTGDSLGASPEDSERAYDELVSRRPSTVLSLAHEVDEPSARVVLPYAIQKLQAAGYELVTVADCLGQQLYLNVGQPQERDGSWQC